MSAEPGRVTSFRIGRARADVKPDLARRFRVNARKKPTAATSSPTRPPGSMLLSIVMATTEQLTG